MSQIISDNKIRLEECPSQLSQITRKFLSSDITKKLEVSSHLLSWYLRMVCGVLRIPLGALARTLAAVLNASWSHN